MPACAVRAPAFLCRVARWRADAVAVIVSIKNNKSGSHDGNSQRRPLKGKVAIVTGAGSRAEGIGMAAHRDNSGAARRASDAGG